MRLLIVCVVMSWWAAAAVRAQAAQPEVVGVDLAAFVVSEETRDDGRVVETFTVAEAVFPGQVIEYRLLATNRSAAVIPAGRLVLVGPVPPQTRYLADSGTVDGPDWRLEASLDGDTFAEPPLVVIETDADGREVEAEADPGTYRALRWVVLRALQPGEQLEFRYRVVVR